MSRILIIEDLEKIRKSLVNVFKREGFDVCYGTGWDRAAELFGRNAYDLVIVDLDVRPSDGYEMLKKIKLSNSDAEIVAIVPPNRYDTARMNSYGVYDYTLKPFRQNEIVNLGKKALEKKQLADKVRNLEQIADMNKSIR
ncbi:MAG: response regulator [Candidatus Brocadia sp.]